MYSYSYMFIILIKNTFYVSEVACLMKYNYLLDIFNIVTYESCLMWNLCSTEHFFVFLFYKGTMIMLTWLLKKQFKHSMSWKILLPKMLSLPLNLLQIRRAYFVSVWHSCYIISLIMSLCPTVVCFLIILCFLCFLCFHLQAGNSVNLGIFKIVQDRHSQNVCPPLKSQSQ